MALRGCCKKTTLTLESEEKDLQGAGLFLLHLQCKSSLIQWRTNITLSHFNTLIEFFWGVESTPVRVHATRHATKLAFVSCLICDISGIKVTPPPIGVEQGTLRSMNSSTLIIFWDRSLLSMLASQNRAEFSHFDLGGYFTQAADVFVALSQYLPPQIYRIEGLLLFVSIQTRDLTPLEKPA